MNFFAQKVSAWFPQLDRRIWILMAGRLLSQVGTGFVLFYAPIFFVNQVGLSATVVGLGLGSQSISGILGRIVGGSFSDSLKGGRRKTLLLAAAVSALADVFLALSSNFPIFLIGNLLMGLGIGLYWPSTEAVVADITTLDQRNEAYALTRLADSLGLGLGVVFGGWLIATTGAYRALFVIDGISFVIFFGIIYTAIAETLHPDHAQKHALMGWKTALGDRPLLVFMVVNILLTTYLAFINSALPLYLSNYVSLPKTGDGFTSTLLSTLFSWYVVLAAFCQLPVARWLNRFSRPQALICSSVCWGISFLLVWATAKVTIGHLVLAGLGLAVMALATVAYTPSASSLVAALSPENMRGVYMSINSLCWAVGYFIGPIVGGWAMDQSRWIADGFWIASALSVGVAILILRYLDRLLQLLQAERKS